MGLSSTPVIIIFFIDMTEYLADTTKEKYLFWLIVSEGSGCTLLASWSWLEIIAQKRICGLVKIAITTEDSEGGNVP